VPDALRQRGGLALRLFVSTTLFVVVLAYADVGDVARLLRDGDWAWFVAALGVMALATVVAGLRWRILLEEAEIEVSRRRAVKTFAASAFLNNVLPTSVGGDAVRTWLVGRGTGRLVRAATATITDRVTALACLFLVGWVAVAFDREAVPNSVIGVFAWVTIGLVSAGSLLALAGAGMRSVVGQFPERLRETIRETWLTLRLWVRSRGVLSWVVALGLVYQALAVLALVLVGKVLGIELPYALAAVSAAIVLVAMMLPVSIGGLGLREGGFVLLLGEAGIDAPEATSLSLLSAAMVLLASLAVFGAAASHDALRVRERGFARSAKGPLDSA
jgi:uncharacterized protein (TIRG00374 family)